MAYIAELQIKVDTTQLDQAKKSLDDLSKISPNVENSTKRVAKEFDDAASAADGYTAAQRRLIERAKEQVATFGEGTTGVLKYRAGLLNVSGVVDPLVNQLRNLKTEQQAAVAAQKEQAAVTNAVVKSQQQLDAAQYKLIESLREEIALFGKSKDEILLYRAGLLGVKDQVAPLITELQRLKQAKIEEEQAGKSDSGGELSKRQAEKQALAEQAKELERIIALEKEKFRAQNQASGAVTPDTTRTRGAEAALGSYQQKLDAVIQKQKQLAGEQFDDLSKEFVQLQYSIDPVSKQLDEIGIKRERLKELQALGIKIPEPELTRLNQLLDNSSNKVLGLGDDFDDLRNSIDPTAKALADLNAKQAQLDASFRAPGTKVTADEYNRLNGILDANRKRISDLGATTGKTAKEINFALRGLPAQFTDIVVSLQGGQDPFTVFLQQGGQIKDSFGGAIPALRELAKFTVGLISPFTLAAAAVAGLTFAYFQGSKEADAYRLALVSTGNAAGTTVAGLGRIAESVGEIEGSVGKASAVLAQLANNTKIDVSSFERVTQVILGWSAASGVATDQLVEDFSKIAKEPLNGVTELNKKYNFLTADIYNQIKALEAQGRTQEAAKVATDALADALDSRTDEMVNNLGYVEAAWKAVKEAVIGTYDAIKDIGRPASDQLSQDIELLKERLRLEKEGGVRGDRLPNQGVIASLEAQITGLEAIQKSNQDLEASAAKREAQEKASFIAAEESTRRIEEAYKSSLSSAQRYRQELKKLDADYDKSKQQGLVTSGVEERYQAARLAIVENINKAEDALIKKQEKSSTNKADTVRVDAAEKLLLSYKQQQSSLEAQIVSQTTLGTEAQKLVKLESQINELILASKTRQLSVDEQSLVKNKDKLLAAQGQVVAAEQALTAEKERVRLLGVSASLQTKIDNDRQKYQDQLAGAGMGDRESQRLEERTRLRREYEKLEKDAADRLADGGDRAVYDEETKQYKDALDTQLDDLAKFYAAEDQARGNWLNGVSKSYSNYLDEGRNVAGLTETFFTNTFQTLEGALVDFVLTGKGSFKDLTVSILADLAKIAAKAAIVSAVTAAFGGGAGSGIGGAIASVFQADGGAWSGGTQFFAKGGAFTNSVVSKPTAFGTGTGLGVMGEAGPEAILPLTRTSDGQLGVKSMGGGNTVVAPVSVTLNTDGGSNAASGSSSDNESQGRAVQQAVKRECEMAIQTALRPGGSIFRAMNGR